MGHTAPKVGQTEMKPAEPPKPAAKSAVTMPKKGGFTTLSSVEYRALNGLTAPVPARPLPVYWKHNPRSPPTMQVPRRSR